MATTRTTKKMGPMEMPKSARNDRWVEAGGEVVPVREVQGQHGKHGADHHLPGELGPAAQAEAALLVQLDGVVGEPDRAQAGHQEQNQQAGHRDRLAVARCPAKYPTSVAMIIRVPPIVGVPRLLAWPARPSSRMGWPWPCRRTPGWPPACRAALPPATTAETRRFASLRLLLHGVRLREQLCGDAFQPGGVGGLDEHNVTASHPAAERRDGGRAIGTLIASPRHSVPAPFPRRAPSRIVLPADDGRPVDPGSGGRRQFPSWLARNSSPTRPSGRGRRRRRRVPCTPRPQRGPDRFGFHVVGVVDDDYASVLPATSIRPPLRAVAADRASAVSAGPGPLGGDGSSSQAFGASSAPCKAAAPAPTQSVSSVKLARPRSSRRTRRRRSRELRCWRRARTSRPGPRSAPPSPSPEGVGGRTTTPPATAAGKAAGGPPLARATCSTPARGVRVPDVQHGADPRGGDLARLAISPAPRPAAPEPGSGCRRSREHG